MAQVYPSTALKMAKATFLKEMKSLASESLLSLLAESESSSSPSEDYVWVGESPRMDLFEDELRTEALSDAQYTLTNQTYSIGIDLFKEDLEDDKLGALRQRARGMARVAVKHPERLIVEAIEAATVTTGYDGSAIFANAHADRGSGSTQDNLLAGTGTTTAQIQTDLNVAIQTMAQFLAENGEPKNDGIGKLVMLAPYGIRRTVREALNAEIISNTSNVGFSDMDISPVFSARLTDANDWYLFHTSGGVKPVIYQERRPLSFEMLDEGSDQWVLKDKATFKVSWRGVVGHGHWADQVKTTNT